MVRSGSLRQEVPMWSGCCAEEPDMPSEPDMLSTASETQPKPAAASGPSTAIGPGGLLAQIRNKMLAQKAAATEKETKQAKQPIAALAKAAKVREEQQRVQEEREARKKALEKERATQKQKAAAPAPAKLPAPAKGLLHLCNLIVALSSALHCTEIQLSTSFGHSFVPCRNPYSYHSHSTQGASRFEEDTSRPVWCPCFYSRMQDARAVPIFHTPQQRQCNTSSAGLDDARPHGHSHTKEMEGANTWSPVPFNTRRVRAASQFVLGSSVLCCSTTVR